MKSLKTKSRGEIVVDNRKRATFAEKLPKKAGFKRQIRQTIFQPSETISDQRQPPGTTRNQLGSFQITAAAGSISPAHDLPDTDDTHAIATARRMVIVGV